MKPLWVYCTAPNAAAARRIARRVIEARLAACANIWPRCASVYRWQGRIETSREAVMIFKTTRAQWPALRRAVVELHPYECPCVIAVEIQDGFRPFLEWIADSVSEPAPGRRRGRRFQ